MKVPGASFTVVYDACVLYSARTRDLLMELAISDLFRARWSGDIHREWMSALRKNRPDIDPRKIERIRELMDEHVLDALVTGYEPYIDTVTLPDPDDRHVLAATIKAQADLIVTFNVTDFPPANTEPHGVIAQHPDEFIEHLFDLFPIRCFQAVQTVRQRLKNPPATLSEYVALLQKAGLNRVATILRNI